MIVIDNFFDNATAEKYYQRISNYPVQKMSHGSWAASLTNNETIPPVLLNDLDTDIHDNVAARLADIIPDFDVSKANILAQRWETGCYIPWHNDAKWAQSGTIYLNPTWSFDDGGQLIFDDKESGDTVEFKVYHSYTPKFNSAVIRLGPNKGQWHCVTPIITSEQTRICIQFFIAK